MRTYRVHIALQDGTAQQHYFLCSDGFEAVIEAMTHFPTARRISAQRIV